MTSSVRDLVPRELLDALGRKELSEDTRCDHSEPRVPTGVLEESTPRMYSSCWARRNWSTIEGVFFRSCVWIGCDLEDTSNEEMVNPPCCASRIAKGGAPLFTVSTTHVATRARAAALRAHRAPSGHIYKYVCGMPQAGRREGGTQGRPALVHTHGTC
jgi:hypothetical protein